MKRYKVLVLGSDNRSFLSVIRSLGRKGIEVHVAGFQGNSHALFSKYIAQKHFFPEYHPDPQNPQQRCWLDFVIQLLNNEKFDLIIPCSDPVITPLQRHRDVLESLAKIVLLSPEAYEVVNDKNKSTELADSVGVNIPESQLIHPEQTNLKEIVADLPLPTILKPLSSFSLNSKSRRAVKRIYERAVLEEELKLMLRFGPVQIQSNFQGIGVGVNVLAINGELKVVFQHQRAHEPFTGGGSSYRKSVQPNQELVDATAKMLRKLNYTGVAMVEFRYDRKTGNWVFLEINGRFWGSLPLALAAGVDFPYYLFLALVENVDQFDYKYKSDIYCRNLEQDIFWLKYALFNADKPALEAMETSRMTVVRESLRLLFLRDHIDTLPRDDLGPGLHEIKDILGYALFKFGKILRHSLNRFSLYRKYRRRQFNKRLHSAKNITFICKGNICRSPFAEKTAAKFLQNGAVFSSYGYYPKPNRPSPKNALEAAESLDIELNQHRSKLLTHNVIDEADLVIYFDEENRRTLLMDYPRAKYKLFEMGIFADDGPLEIPDPYGQSKPVFRKTYEEIYFLIKNASK